MRKGHLRDLLLCLASKRDLKLRRRDMWLNETDNNNVVQIAKKDVHRF